MPRSRQRWLLWSGGIIAALVVAALSWVGYRGAQAQHAMSHASERLTSLQRDLAAGNSGAVTSDVAAIKKETARARSSSDGPIFNIVSDVPYLGRTPRAARGLAQAADNLASGPLRSIVGVASSLSAKRVRGSDGTIDLTALAGATNTLRTVETQLGEARARLLHASHGAFVLDPVDRARAATLRTVEHVAATVSVGARFATLAPSMLGSDTTRHYLVVVQNNNQARATGGVADTYATIDARLGQVRLTTAHLIAGLSNAKDWSRVNLTPDFPAAAKQWAKLWHQASPKQPIDGVIALDPVALEHVVSATGPIVINTRTVATASTVVRRAEVRYAEVKRPRIRDLTLTGLAKQVLTSAFTGHGQSQRLAIELGKAAADGHLQLWSTHPTEQSVIAETSFGGVLPTSASPFVEVVVNNTSGAKLDYFLQRSLSYFADSCHGTTRPSTITVRLNNGAPAKPAPFLTAHTDHPPARTPATQLRFAVSVYASRGAKLDSATLDGRPITMKQQTDHGHAVFVTNVAIDRLSTRTLSLQLVEPRLAGPAIVPVQPLAQGQRLAIQAAVCRAR